MKYREYIRSLGRRRLITLVCLLFIVLGGGIWLITGLLSSGQTGFMRVCVRDGETDAPIPGAQVLIPETGGVYITDEQGMTPIMELPVLKDAHYAGLLAQDYGLITVIVKSEGYLPYALFFAHVEPGRLRKGPNIWLFPGAGAPFSVIEGPNEDWVSRFIKEYSS